MGNGQNLAGKMRNASRKLALIRTGTGRTEGNIGTEVEFDWAQDLEAESTLLSDSSLPPQSPDYENNPVYPYQGKQHIRKTIR